MSTRRSPRWRGCCAPAGGSASSSTTRCCRPRAADGSTTRCSIRPSSTGGSARTSIEDETIEEVEKGVFIPFIHRPLSALLNALADNGLVLERMVEPAPPPGFLALAPESTPRRRRSRGCCISACGASTVGRFTAMAEIVLITGLSGAGRSAAAAVLEDLGWYVVDNLPTSLLGNDRRAGVEAGRWHRPLGTRVRTPTLRRAARTSAPCAPPATASRSCSSMRRRSELVAALRRTQAQASAGRRGRRAGRDDRARAARARATVQDAADLVIDTTDLNVHQLKAVGRERSSRRRLPTRLQVAVESFGYKHGLPLDADIVMDVRFLPNPHWDDAAAPADRPRPGRARLRARDRGRAGVPRSVRGPARAVLPAYEAEGKSYLTIAIGCTGGRHRSVAIAEELARRFRARGRRRAHVTPRRRRAG